MTNELIFIGIRFVSSLPIIRFPLLGVVLAIIVDYFDFEILKFLNHGDLLMYQNLDKSMDLFYLGLAAYASLRWTNALARRAAIGLFFLRLVGFGLFVVFQTPWLLLLFPNVFEWFYLYYLSYKKFFKKDPVETKKQLFGVLVLLTIPKLAHEYLLHINTVHPWWKVPLLLIHKS